MNIPPAFESPQSAIDTILRGLRNRLTFAENIQCRELTVITPSTPDQEFTVQHNMGKTPRVYIANTSVAATVYDSRRTDWSSTVMYLKCSVGGTTITLTVF